jgi:hypothetical protein
MYFIYDGDLLFYIGPFATTYYFNFFYFIQYQYPYVQSIPKLYYTKVE